MRDPALVGVRGRQLPATCATTIAPEPTVYPAANTSTGTSHNVHGVLARALLSGRKQSAAAVPCGSLLKRAKPDEFKRLH